MDDARYLAQFLVESRENCSYEVAEPVRLPDGTRVIGPYTRGKFTFIDRYWDLKDASLTGFEGRAEIKIEGSPEMWIVKYSGKVKSKYVNRTREIYDFLRESLRQFPRNKPFRRGPAFFQKGDMAYVNVSRGDMTSFWNTERIVIGEDVAYSYSDAGGMVNKQEGGSN